MTISKMFNISTVYMQSKGFYLNICYRSQSLQRAKMAYNNYRNDYDNLNMWLSRVPNYEPRETDDVGQVETKLKNQRVGTLALSSHTFLR
jgi:hypothetical protein